MLYTPVSTYEVFVRKAGGPVLSTTAFQLEPLKPEILKLAGLGMALFVIGAGLTLAGLASLDSPKKKSA